MQERGGDGGTEGEESKHDAWRTGSRERADGGGRKDGVRRGDNDNDVIVFVIKLIYK